MAATVADEAAVENRLLASLSAAGRRALLPHLTEVALEREQVLFEPGDDVKSCHFPCGGTMVSLVVMLPDGELAETATVGCEGAIGGIVSAGHKPAFARGIVQIPGRGLRIDSERLEELKEARAELRETFARYADCLIAQVLQSVACNVLHRLEPRFARWLLTAHDRSGTADVPLTQEFLAEMLGVQRTTVTAVAQTFAARGLIRYTRGRVTVLDRAGLEGAACPCHAAVVEHFERVLPGVYPRVAG